MPKQEPASHAQPPTKSALSASAIDVHVGQRVRQRREDLGVSQGRLARQLGLTFSQIQKYEKGSNRIGAGRLYLAADYLGVPIAYFFEDLEAGAAPEPAQPSSAETALLHEAFAAVADPETRRSIIALVCSLTTRPGRAERTRRAVVSVG